MGVKPLPKGLVTGKSANLPPLTTTCTFAELAADHERSVLNPITTRPVFTPLKPRKMDPYKSKWERLYAMELQDAFLRGEILVWEYEAISFRIARGFNGKRGASYTPDFFVVRADHEMELIEVKGFMREAARVRFLACRDKYPHFKWRMISRTKTGWVDIL